MACHRRLLRTARRPPRSRRVDLFAKAGLEHAHNRLASAVPPRVELEVAGRASAPDLRPRRAEHPVHFRCRRIPGDLSRAVRARTTESNVMKSLDQKLANIHA